MERAARPARRRMGDSTSWAGQRRALRLVGSLTTAACVALSNGPSAAAEHRVVVLMPRDLPAGAWPEGTQAVIAELAASSYQVIVESSRARELDALLSELRARANHAENAGAVSVLRSHGSGVAYVWTRRDENVARVQTDTTEGAVSVGSLALRVLELIRARGLRLPEEPEEPEEPAAEAPPPKDVPSPVPSARAEQPTHGRRARLWLGMGTTFAQGSPRPLVDASLGGRFVLFRPLALEAGAALSLAPVELVTRAGEVELSTRRLTLHLMADVWRAGSVRFAFGAGGGALWVAESARALDGYRGHADQTFLGLASLRATATLENGAFAFGIAAEPGLAWQRASIRSSGEELLRIGHSWASVTASLGWSP